ncbi:MAG: 1-acyl-sn-glycerol-3-phosphate acyltransferase [Caldilineaceae bacterium]|nr:1-acyl-sn-glycerol-3-phosphate acyltransferase [Caldilineaceae bacterium]
MKQILGAVRVVLVIGVLVGGTGLLLLAALLRLRWHGIPVANRIPVGMSRLFNLIFNVRLTVHDHARLRAHRGFVVPNHISFIDIVVMFAVMPVRFLSAIEVKRRPVIGWAASAAGTIFVDRSDIHSRRQAVLAIADSYLAAPDPPIVIFAEGRLGTGDRVYPFQLGLFKLAKQHNIAYLPVAIQYDRPDIAVWRGREGESLVEAGWKAATFWGPLHVSVTPLDLVSPTSEDHAAQLADAAQVAIAAKLALPAVPARAKAGE